MFTVEIKVFGLRKVKECWLFVTLFMGFQVLKSTLMDIRGSRSCNNVLRSIFQCTERKLLVEENGSYKFSLKK